MTSLVVVDVLVLKYVLAFLASEGRSTASTMKCLLAAFLLQIKACGQIFKRTFDKNFSQDHNCSKRKHFFCFRCGKMVSRCYWYKIRLLLSKNAKTSKIWYNLWYILTTLIVLNSKQTTFGSKTEFFWIIYYKYRAMPWLLDSMSKNN